METKKRVLIADANEEFRQLFVAELHRTPEFELVGETDNGEEAVGMIGITAPDVVVMDLMLYNMDGLDVLKELGRRLPKPHILVLSNFARGNIAQHAAARGADYCMLKPCRIAAVVERLSQLSTPLYGDEDVTLDEERQLELRVTEVIQELEISPRIKGYHYLRAAIIIATKDLQMLHAVTKILYPMVGKQFDTTGACVERAMRHAIEVSWAESDPEMLRKYFRRTADSAKGRPTSSEFIATIADRLQARQSRK